MGQLPRGFLKRREEEDHNDGVAIRAITFYILAYIEQRLGMRRFLISERTFFHFLADLQRLAIIPRFLSHKVNTQVK